MEGGNRVYYLSVPRTVSVLGLYCMDAGAMYTPPGTAYPLHPEEHPGRYRNVAEAGRALREHQVVFVSRGEGRDFPIRAGSLILVRAGIWQRYRPDPRTGWYEYWVGFDGAAVPAVVEALFPHGESVWHTEQPDSLAAAFERLVTLAALSAGGRADAHVENAAHTLLLLTMASRAIDRYGLTDGGPPARGAVDRAIRIMELHTAGTLDVPALAESVGCSESTLRRLFVRHTGMSPYKYFLRLKVNAAKSALAHSALSIKGIAAELGFSDQYHFSRVFRATSGQSPREWRRMHSGR